VNNPIDNSNPITLFAKTNFRNQNMEFGIKDKDRSGHMYIIGKTGTGKSTLLKNMVVSDIKAGNGVALIDPHGDLAEDILNFIPKDRIEDVIYFNPADIEYPIAFNPLAKAHPDYHHLIASGLISVFKKLWPSYWGARMEHILRNAIMALLEYPNSTLVDLPRLLTNDSFRNQVLRYVTNQQVKEFWFSEFANYSKWYKSEAASPILNKVGQFLTATPIRNIVGQKANAFSLRKVMDEKKILIVNLAKGRIGEDNGALLGAMIVTKIQLAALSRANIQEEERIPFYLYVDEVHNFLTESFADILSEARKYGLRLILTHQYIKQLDEDMISAIFGNIGTIISFRVGAKDADYLSREFHPVFGESDFVNLPNYHIYLKLMIDGFTSKAFSANTILPPEVGVSYSNEIIHTSRGKYGRIREEKK
jgi:type IV secretory pathway TraG/TraD family ATPase VirD4